MSQIGNNEEEDEEEEEEEEEETLSLSIQPRIKTFQEAIHNLSDVANFLDMRGYTAEATDVCCIINKVTALHYSTLSKTRQTTLDDYFHT